MSAPTSASFARLVQGSAPGEMALSEAASRSSELRRSLDELATALATRPDALTWPNVLDQLAVAASQAAGLRARVRPLTRAYAAHPAPGARLDAATAAALPVWLSSRRLPGMEAAAEEAVAAAAAAAGVPAGRAGELYAALAGRADALNAVVDGLLGGGGGASRLPALARGALDPRGARRREFAARLHTESAAAATAAAAAGSGAVLGGGAAAVAAPAAAATSGPPDPAAALVKAALEGRLP